MATTKAQTAAPAPAAEISALTAQAAGGALMVIDYGDDAGAGLANIERDEIRIPMFRVLQSNSPQCQPVEAGGTEGAKAGMIFNTVTGEMFDGKEGLLFIPVDRDHNFVEYVPRDEGGGFVGVHDPHDTHILDMRDAQGKFGKLKSRSDALGKPTEIVETFYLFGMLVDAEGTLVCGVVPFTSTQISKYQAFMTRYMSIKYPNSKGDKITPPLWAHKWWLRTVYQTNKKGSFFGWLVVLETEPAIQSRMRLDDPLYQQGKAFYEMLKSGAASIDREADQRAGGMDEGGGTSAGGPDDEIPF